MGPNGTLKAEGADKTEDDVALSTNNTKWKTDYPSLKVSRPAGIFATTALPLQINTRYYPITPITQDQQIGMVTSRKKK